MIGREGDWKKGRKGKERLERERREEREKDERDKKAKIGGKREEKGGMRDRLGEKRQVEEGGSCSIR